MKRNHKNDVRRMSRSENVRMEGGEWESEENLPVKPCSWCAYAELLVTCQKVKPRFSFNRSQSAFICEGHRVTTSRDII